MIRGKLEAMELGITRPEAEFLANFVLPDGGTVRQSSVYRHRVVAMDDEWKPARDKTPQKHDAPHKERHCKYVMVGIDFERRRSRCGRHRFRFIYCELQGPQMDPDPSPAQHNRPACLVHFRRS